MTHFGQTENKNIYFNSASVFFACWLLTQKCKWVRSHMVIQLFDTFNKCHPATLLPANHVTGRKSCCVLLNIICALHIAFNETDCKGGHIKKLLDVKMNRHICYLSSNCYLLHFSCINLTNCKEEVAM